MLNLRVALGLAGVLALPLSLHADTLIINGQQFEIDSINIKTTSGTTTITTSPEIDLGSGGDPTDPEPTDPEPTDPEPTDPEPTDPDAGNCTVPSNVQLATSPLEWSKSWKDRFDLRHQIRSFPINTTNTTSASGQLNTHYTTTNPSTRTAWISKCPGDSPQTVIDDSTLGYRCVSEGYETSVIRWTQGSGRACELTPNTRYYFNVKNARISDFNNSTCSGTNCPFIIDFSLSQ